MPQATCSIDGCDRPAKSRGWCLPHYQRWYKTGGQTHEPARFTDLAERFWSKVERSDGCWMWTAYVMPNGYGQFCYGSRETSRRALAHRYAYELAVGPIPQGLHLDHLCRNRACVNPAHLEPVTQRENNRRANDIRWSKWRAANSSVTE